MKKRLKGIVISDKMDKTIVVKIDRILAHPVYQKRYRISKKYKVHDEKNEYKIGDLVEIEESKPLSKDKKWKVIIKRQKVKSKSKNKQGKQ